MYGNIQGTKVTKCLPVLLSFLSVKHFSPKISNIVKEVNSKQKILYGVFWINQYLTSYSQLKIYIFSSNKCVEFKKNFSLKILPLRTLLKIS